MASIQKAPKTASLLLEAPTTSLIPLSSGEEAKAWLSLLSCTRNSNQFFIFFSPLQCARVGRGRSEWRSRTRPLPPAAELSHTRSPLWNPGQAGGHRNPRHCEGRGDHRGLQPDRLGRERHGEMFDLGVNDNRPAVPPQPPQGVPTVYLVFFIRIESNSVFQGAGCRGAALRSAFVASLVKTENEHCY